MEDYGVEPDRRLADLRNRVHRGSYRTQPSRRHYIAKPDRRQRPLGIASLEDRIVQRAVAGLSPLLKEKTRPPLISPVARIRRSPSVVVVIVILIGSAIAIAAATVIALEDATGEAKAN